jgi:hypothetical protein
MSYGARADSADFVIRVMGNYVGRIFAEVCSSTPARSRSPPRCADLGDRWVVLSDSLRRKARDRLTIGPSHATRLAPRRPAALRFERSSTKV